MTALPEAERVFDIEATEEVVAMMEQVSERGGTAAKASGDHYRVAGKTGTARVLDQGGYNDERHVALFAGIAPVSNPRIVMVVVVNEPQSGSASGGQAAAPSFARVAQHSLRPLGADARQRWRRRR